MTKIKNKFKKTAAFIIALLMLIILASVCDRYAVKADGSKESTVRIVAEIFPVYDWLRNIVGDNPGEIEISLLMKNGTDLHSYQPSVSDIMNISSCDIIVFIGGESDKWVEDAAADAVNQDITVLKLMDLLGNAALAEEEIEGPETNEKDHSENDQHIHENEEYDEHIWLSLKNAQLLCSGITDALCEADPDHADYYRANLSEYLDQLEKLDARYLEACEKGRVRTLLFADRFPFLYLTRDYGLNYYAAFDGCSAETEASFETIIFLARKTDELKLKNVMIIDGSDAKIANTVVQNTGLKDQAILTLDSMQSINQVDIDEGVSYLGIMENNLTVLEKALE